MKKIPWLVRWLAGGRTRIKNSEPPVLKKVKPSSVENKSGPAPVPFADDTSPPGHKIRWHH
jgi:hypothetical protein